MRPGLYETNVTTIKVIGPIYKIATLAFVRRKGFEIEARAPRGTANTEKLENNILRAKNTVMEYGLCNPWDWFVTLTLDQAKYDRFDLKKYIRDLNVMISNYNRFCGPAEAVRYVLIPEQHKDGAWHMHGLVRGIRPRDLRENANGYMEWKQYAERFGYMSMGKIKSPVRVARYISKYITKDMAAGNRELNAHLYYCSRGLARGDTIWRGQAEVLRTDYAREDGFCKLTWCESDQELSEVFVSKTEENCKKLLLNDQKGPYTLHMPEKKENACSTIDAECDRLIEKGVHNDTEKTTENLSLRPRPRGALCAC